jgi:hypothetical protein
MEKIEKRRRAGIIGTRDPLLLAGLSYIATADHAQPHPGRGRSLIRHTKKMLHPNLRCPLGRKVLEYVKTLKFKLSL